MDRRRAEAEVLKVWNHLIDPNIVAHAQPTGLNKGTLFVTIDSSVWLDANCPLSAQGNSRPAVPRTASGGS